MIRPGFISAVAIATSMLATAPALARDAYVYGPAPDWEQYKQLGTAAVLAQIPDAASWEVVWRYGYQKHYWRHKGRFDGYLACGSVEHSVPEEGVYRRINFVVVIDYGVVKRADLSTRESNSLVNVSCASMIEQGQFPPATVMEGPTEFPIERLGIVIRPMAEGAYVFATIRGISPAAPGLLRGMVITRVNGVALAGLGRAMTQMVSGHGELSLETATGQTIRVSADH